MYSTYSESDLIVPAVAIIGAHPDGITTSDLISALRRELKPKGDDLELLANRSDDRFSQKVRNLKSHDTLEKKNLAIFVDAKYYITEYGSEFVVGGKEISESLRNQGFSEPQRRRAIDNNYFNIVIEEGQRIASDRAVIQRSALLRRAAFKHFADTDGSIACMGCGFRAEEVYGEKARGIIEMHHTEPLFLSAGGSVRVSVEAAIKNITPLCPNCHRIVHMDSARCMPIHDLRGLLSER